MPRHSLFRFNLHFLHEMVDCTDMPQSNNKKLNTDDSLSLREKLIRTYAKSERLTTSLLPDPPSQDWKNNSQARPNSEKNSDQRNAHPMNFTLGYCCLFSSLPVKFRLLVFHISPK